MTDFVRDLEAELTAAARRRAAGRRRPAWRPVRRRLAPALAALAAVGAAAAGVTAAVVGTAAPPGDERAVGEPPPGGPDWLPMTLPGAGTFTQCGAAAQGRPVPSAKPAEILGVLRRDRSPADDPGVLRRGGRMLAPVTTYLEEQVRRPRGIRGVDVRIVPTVGVLAAHCGESLARTPRGPGACLLTRRRAFLAVRCFTLDAVRAGRALTLAAPREHVVGIVPDGVVTVELRIRGAASAGVRGVVRDNAFAVRLPGARRGARIEVLLRRDERPGVAFLNGTTVAGLAGRAEQVLRRSGYDFRTAVVGNAADQQVANSRVHWTRDRDRTPVEVSGRLGIGDLAPAIPELRALAPDADVIVVLGRDWRPPSVPDDAKGYEPPPEDRGGGQ